MCTEFEVLGCNSAKSCAHNLKLVEIISKVAKIVFKHMTAITPTRSVITYGHAPRTNDHRGCVFGDVSMESLPRWQRYYGVRNSSLTFCSAFSFACMLLSLFLCLLIAFVFCFLLDFFLSLLLDFVLDLVFGLVQNASSAVICPLHFSSY